MEDNNSTATVSYSLTGGGDHAYGYFPYKFKHLEGRILTILETIGLNEKQEKALKDVVKNALYEFCGGSFYISAEQAQAVRSANEKSGGAIANGSKE